MLCVCTVDAADVDHRYLSIRFYFSISNPLVCAFVCVRALYVCVLDVGCYSILRRYKGWV